MPIKDMTFDEVAELYCTRQDSTPGELRAKLQHQANKFQPDGWVVYECAMLDSSRLGEITLVPYGPRNTFRVLPAEGQPFSPRGLASDTAVPIGNLPMRFLC